MEYEDGNEVARGEPSCEQLTGDGRGDAVNMQCVMGAA